MTKSPYLTLEEKVVKIKDYMIDQLGDDRTEEELKEINKMMKELDEAIMNYVYSYNKSTGGYITPDI
jgi:hypothetical protein